MIIKNAGQRGYLSSESLDKTISDILSYKKAEKKEIYLVSIHIKPPIYKIVEFDWDWDMRPDNDEEGWEDYISDGEKENVIYNKAKEQLYDEESFEYVDRLPSYYDGDVVTVEKMDSEEEAKAWIIQLKKDDLLMARNVDEEAYRELDEEYKALTGRTFRQDKDEYEREREEEKRQRVEKMTTPQTCTCNCALCEAVREKQPIGNLSYNKFNHCYNQMGYTEEAKKYKTGKCYDTIYNHPDFKEFDEEKDIKNMYIWDPMWKITRHI